MAAEEHGEKSSLKLALDLDIIQVPVFKRKAPLQAEREIPLSAAKGEIPISYELKQVSMPPEITQEAGIALEKVLIQLIQGDERYAKRLGFETENEAHNCMLGRPLQVIEIGLHDLRNYKSGSSFLEKFFVDQVKNGEEKPVPWRLVYPICRKDKPTCTAENVRTALILKFTPKDGKWHVGGIGLGGLIRKVFQYKKDNENSFIIWVPALNGYYLGTFHQNSMGIKPLVNDPRFKFVEGAPVPWDFFTKLKKEAFRIDEEKPH